MAQQHPGAGATPPPLFKVESLDMPSDPQAAQRREASVKLEPDGDGEAVAGRPAKRARGSAKGAPGYASPGMAPDAAGKFSPRPGQTVTS